MGKKRPNPKTILNTMQKADKKTYQVLKKDFNPKKSPAKKK